MTFKFDDTKNMALPSTSALQTPLCPQSSLTHHVSSLLALWGYNQLREPSAKSIISSHLICTASFKRKYPAMCHSAKKGEETEQWNDENNNWLFMPGATCFSFCFSSSSCIIECVAAQVALERGVLCTSPHPPPLSPLPSSLMIPLPLSLLEGAQ